MLSWSGPDRDDAPAPTPTTRIKVTGMRLGPSARIALGLDPDGPDPGRDVDPDELQERS